MVFGFQPKLGLDYRAHEGAVFDFEEFSDAFDAVFWAAEGFCQFIWKRDV